MSMREQYENLDRYAAYDYKDVLNAYGHGEDDALEKVLDIIDKADSDYEIWALKFQKVREAVLALKGGEQE